MSPSSAGHAPAVAVAAQVTRRTPRTRRGPPAGRRPAPRPAASTSWPMPPSNECSAPVGPASVAGLALPACAARPRATMALNRPPWSRSSSTMRGKAAARLRLARHSPPKMPLTMGSSMVSANSAPSRRAPNWHTVSSVLGPLGCPAQIARGRGRTARAGHAQLAAHGEQIGGQERPGQVGISRRRAAHAAGSAGARRRCCAAAGRRVRPRATSRRVAGSLSRKPLGPHSSAILAVDARCAGCRRRAARPRSP